MKEKIDLIFSDLKNEVITEKEAHNLVLQLFNIKTEPTEEEPKLVGYLNRSYGYNGFLQIEKGSPVYEFKDRYYFEMTPTNEGKVQIQKFYKDTLKPHIDFSI
jgi:hypothetical protein